MESLKCQLNFKTSTQILTNQSQIQTKMQQETKSHPKHIVKTSTTWKVTKYGVISGPYFPAFGLNTERYFSYLSVFSPHAGKYGPEIIPYLDTYRPVRDNYNISTIIKRKDTKQGKLQKNSIANLPD